jgi:hypothetical protein
LSYDLMETKAPNRYLWYEILCSRTCRTKRSSTREAILEFEEGLLRFILQPFSLIQAESVQHFQI